MKVAKLVSAMLMVFITTPIWFYLLYKILEAVGASDLMWFLYFVYVPVSLLTSIVYKLCDES